MAALKNPVTEKDHIQGNKDAPVTLIEYGDYQCPVCAQAFPIVEEIKKHFGDKLRFVFRHFPLTEMHPFAEPAAETAEFAGEQNKFWEMHDLLYVNQSLLGLPLLLKLASSLNLSEEKLKIALENGAYRGKIKSDFLSGVYSGVSGTPTFFVNGERHIGLMPFAAMVAAIEKYL
jgi:protein-disulfide isomerase